MQSGVVDRRSTLSVAMRPAGECLAAPRGGACRCDRARSGLLRGDREVAVEPEQSGLVEVVEHSRAGGHRCHLRAPSRLVWSRKRSRARAARSGSSSMVITRGAPLGEERRSCRRGTCRSRPPSDAGAGTRARGAAAACARWRAAACTRLAHQSSSCVQRVCQLRSHSPRDQPAAGGSTLRSASSTCSADACD